jgi:hypothetical protein
VNGRAETTAHRSDAARDASIPEGIEELLLRIDEQGTTLGYWRLGEN